MAGASLTIEIDQLRDGLAGLLQRTTERKPALRAIGRAGVAGTRRRFLSGRAPDGTAWKKGRKPTGKTLIAGALLLNSISDQPPTDEAVEWGSNRTYAAVHQFGFDGIVGVSQHSRVVRKIFGRPVNPPVSQHVTAHQRHMKTPPRPYLGISAEDGETMAMILLRWVALGEAA